MEHEERADGTIGTDLHKELDAFAKNVLSAELSRLAARIRQDVHEELEIFAGRGLAPGEDAGNPLDAPSTGMPPWSCHQECEPTRPSTSNSKASLPHCRSAPITGLRKTANEVEIAAGDGSRAMVSTTSDKSPKKALWTPAAMKADKKEEKNLSPKRKDTMARFMSTMQLEVAHSELLDEARETRAKRAANQAGARMAARIVSSQWFENVIITAIVANGFYIGFITDYRAKKRMSDTPTICDVIECMFLAIFVTEISLKFCVDRTDLFRAVTREGGINHSQGWNIFDFTIVSLQAVEFILRHLNIKAVTENLGRVSILRLLRLLRLVRVVRLVKVFRLVSDLRMIVFSIYRSLSIFFWSVVALLFVIYIFAVYFAAAVLDRRIDYKSNNSLYSAEVDERLEKHFGSVYTAMFSLLKCITGGVDWGDMAELLHLGTVDWIFGEAIFTGYVAFNFLALSNVIMGVFMDVAMDRAKNEREFFLVKSAKAVFEEADHTGDGTITWKDFESALSHSNVHKFFSEIDLQVSEAQTLFELLDSSNDGFISSDEFMKGCLRLRGPAKALDLLSLHRELMLHVGLQEDQIAAIVPAASAILGNRGESRGSHRGTEEREGLLSWDHRKVPGNDEDGNELGAIQCRLSTPTSLPGQVSGTLHDRGG